MLSLDRVGSLLLLQLLLRLPRWHLTSFCTDFLLQSSFLGHLTWSLLHPPKLLPLMELVCDPLVLSLLLAHLSPLPCRLLPPPPPKWYHCPHYCSSLDRDLVSLMVCITTCSVIKSTGVARAGGRRQGELFNRYKFHICKMRSPGGLFYNRANALNTAQQNPSKWLGGQNCCYLFYHDR